MSHIQHVIWNMFPMQFVIWNMFLIQSDVKRVPHTTCEMKHDPHKTWYETCSPYNLWYETCSPYNMWYETCSPSLWLEIFFTINTFCKHTFLLGKHMYIITVWLVIKHSTTSMTYDLNYGMSNLTSEQKLCHIITSPKSYV